MAEATPADLKPGPNFYQSSRSLWEVLIGEDSGRDLLDISSRGDVTALRDMLEQSPEVALDAPHRIYSQDRAAKDSNDVRRVLARELPNVNHAIQRAAENGHAEAVSMLLDFASRHGMKPSRMIGHEIMRKPLENGHIAVFEALATAHPQVVHYDVVHGKAPLDMAIAKGNTELARSILQHGGAPESPIRRAPEKSYAISRLSRAARIKPLAELLISYGYVVQGSGALQMAAERGALDSIRFLVEEHSADVNEILPIDSLPVYYKTTLASWTPMHFAASGRAEEAMKLLESYGAKSDVVDVKGRTPWQLLQVRKDELNQKT